MRPRARSSRCSERRLEDRVARGSHRAEPAARSGSAPQWIHQLCDTIHDRTPPRSSLVERRTPVGYAKRAFHLSDGRAKRAGVTSSETGALDGHLLPS